MAVEETGMGVVEDKVIKNHYAAAIFAISASTLSTTAGTFTFSAIFSSLLNNLKV